MDAYLAILNSPFAAQGQLDENFNDNDGGRFYGSDGEANQVDHRHLQEGATFGDPGYRKSSGHYVKTNDLRGRNKRDY